MKLERYYDYALFAPEDVQRAVDVFRELADPEAEEDFPGADFRVTHGTDTWTLDNDAEFWDAYRRGVDTATYGLRLRRTHSDESSYDYYRLQLNVWPRRGGVATLVDVEMPDREAILRIMSVFDGVADKATRRAEPEPEPEPEPTPMVFIGHGRSPLWRDLKDHLHEQHGYDVEAYETGARAGHAIRDILESMVDEASFAILVMTGEDEQPDGSVRARQNVVHELGLFQGRLGFSRAIVALEEGTEEFSNIYGIHQVRFSRGNIREIYGDVLATLRREFRID